MSRRPQQGISLIGAIFFITVIALLTVALTRSVATSAQAGTADIHRLNALLAAETGAQLGAHAVLPPTGVANCSNRTVALDNFNLPACQARLSCRVELVEGRRYFTIQSEGICQDGGNVAAQRTILLRLKEA
ncbi:MAG: hypothetical protein RIC89_06215 [Pseudomonadales bacterium]